MRKTHRYSHVHIYMRGRRGRERSSEVKKKKQHARPPRSVFSENLKTVAINKGKSSKKKTSNTAHEEHSNSHCSSKTQKRLFMCVRA